MNLDALFESPEHLLTWVQEEFKTLDALAMRFLETQDYTVVTQYDSATQRGDLCIKLSQAPPVALRGHTANIIKNLRDSLDQATSAASKFILGKHTNQAHFPFGESPDDLENSLSKRKAAPCRGIPAALYPILRTFEPYPTSNTYPGGNNPLRLLGRVSGNHKHDVTLGVGADTGGFSMSGDTILDGVIFGKPEWDGANNQIKLFGLQPGANLKTNLNIAYFVAFSQGPLDSVPVIPFIASVGKMSITIVKKLKEAAAGIGPPT